MIFLGVVVRKEGRKEGGRDEGREGKEVGRMCYGAGRGLGVSSFSQRTTNSSWNGDG